MKNNNLYNYSTPKSGNEETNFFNNKGRITVSAFFLRFFLAIAIYCFSCVINNLGIYKKFGLRFENFFETIHLYILPLILVLFVLILGAKRVHDINKSGWYFFIPVYNIFLCLGKGTEGSNDYGIDPKPMKSVTYFDEIEPKLNAEKVIDYKSSSQFNKSYIPFILVFLVIFFAIWYSTMHKSIFTVVDDSTIIAPDSTNAKRGIDDSELIDNNNTNGGFDESELIDENEKKIDVSNAEEMLLGNKTFGHQFIEPYGNALITLENNVLKIIGEQRRGEEYCIISGVIDIINDRNFYFTGKISVKQYTTTYKNNQTIDVIEDKTLKDRFLFRRIGDRKYWRLKQSDNSLTGFFDYCWYDIDIFMN